MSKNFEIRFTITKLFHLALELSSPVNLLTPPESIHLTSATPTLVPIALTSLPLASDLVLLKPILHSGEERDLLRT